MSQVVILLSTSKSFSPAEETMLKKSEVFRLEKKNFEFLVSFSHTEEKLA